MFAPILSADIDHSNDGDVASRALSPSSSRVLAQGGVTGSASMPGSLMVPVAVKAMEDDLPDHSTEHLSTLHRQFSSHITTMQQSVQQWSEIMEGQVRELLNCSKVLDRMNLAAMKRLDAVSDLARTLVCHPKAPATHPSTPHLVSDHIPKDDSKRGGASKDRVNKL
eukprot:CAMPEP_0206602838 /NCGR_PEP_ID=MMETSP0325_2-20121206/47758_1 /ASSEMBLY_ACC=CAM_ASM_000347 /TAXON_ID=2866 /ORGANISM="Crypthecodinium cohnii, Strain Seligo" /LENGTH=166 /DNA_ID=CAMNT_0054115667 /DNA_START=29 /DNA_END=529 /DNA_ORIENTATION=-